MIDTKALRNRILDLAIQGKLTEQLESDGTAEDLFSKNIKDVDDTPFDIPNNWKWCKGNDCFKPMESRKPTGEYFNYIDIDAIDNKHQKINQIRIVPTKEAPSRASRAVFDGSTLFSLVRPYLRNIAYVDSEASNSIASTGFFVATSNGSLYPLFLYYMMISDYVVMGLNEFMKGDNSPSIRKGHIEQWLFPVPPLAEQKRIVERVEEIFRLLDTIDKAQEKYSADSQILKAKLITAGIQGKLTKQLESDGTAHELYQQIKEEKDNIIKERQGRKDNSINPVEDDVPYEIPVNWKWIRFGETGFFRKGPFGSSLTKSMFVPKSDDSIKVYEQQHAIKKDHTLGTYYITKEYFDESMKGFEVLPDDIIISCAGTIGETFIMPDNIEKGIINQALMRVTVVPSIDKQFFLYYFNSQLKESAKEGNGSAITNIPPFDVLKNLYFPLPPLAEQKRIADVLEKVLGAIEYNAVKKNKSCWEKQRDFYKELFETRFKMKNPHFQHSFFNETLKSACNNIINMRAMFHQLICHKMFADILDGEDVYVYIDNYDAIYSGEEHYMSAFINATSQVSEPVEYLRCSVVSEKMLEYDKLMFREIAENNNSEEKVNYRPYFMEFVIPVDRNGNTKGYYNNNDLLQDINSENGWFEARFVPNSDEDSWINGSYVEGGMLTFASPADYISGKLVFQNPAFKRTSKALRADIEGVYDIIQERKTDEINKLLEDHILNIKWANVYNIGHGNFITLTDDNDNTKAIYDIGLPYAFPISKSPRIMKQDYKAVYNEMKNIKAEIVIISHWDSDHYIGAYENKQDIFDIPWIVTECNPKGQINAKRIMAYLYCKKNINYRNNLFLYKGNPTNTQLAFAEYDDNKSYKFQLYKGHGTSPMITPINCQGIAVRISINDVSTLMCGDIPYDCLSDNIINDNVYEYVVIPHHASNMDQKSYDALAKINSIKYPIICVNNKEKLGKTKTAVENGEHCDKIKKKSGNNVFFTDNNTHSLKKYELDLSSQNSLTQI